MDDDVRRFLREELEIQRQLTVADISHLLQEALGPSVNLPVPCERDTISQHGAATANTDVGQSVKVKHVIFDHMLLTQDDQQLHPEDSLSLPETQTDTEQNGEACSPELGPADIELTDQHEEFHEELTDDCIDPFKSVLQPDTPCANNSGRLSLSSAHTHGFRPIHSELLDHLAIPTTIHRLTHFLGLDQVDFSEDVDTMPLAIRSSCIYRLVHSIAFRAVMSLVIIANSISIGLHTEHLVMVAMEASDKADPKEWVMIERVFTTIFAIEVVLRIIAERRLFVFGVNGRWNMFDALLVFESLGDVLIALASQGQSAPNISFARTLRIMRFAKILRVVRVIRAFRSFRVMIHSILHSLLSLLWVFIMIFFVMYCFSLLLLQGIAVDFPNVDSNAEVVQQLRDSWSTIPRALLSLFMAITGGKDWRELYMPLALLHPTYGALFIFYIYFAVFGVLNVVTSVFIDATYQASLSDRDNVVQSEIDRNNLYLNSCKTFLSRADKQRTGELTWEQFEDYLQDEKVRAYLTTLELDESQARALFMLLDVNDNGFIAIDEFVLGCARLKGEAKSIDVNMLLYENEKMIGRHLDFMELTRGKLETIEAHLGIAPVRKLLKTHSTPSENKARAFGDTNASPSTSPKAKSVNPKAAPASHRKSIVQESRLDHAVDVLSRTSEKALPVSHYEPVDHATEAVAEAQHEALRLMRNSRSMHSRQISK